MTLDIAAKAQHMGRIVRPSHQFNMARPAAAAFRWYKWSEAILDSFQPLQLHLSKGHGALVTTVRRQGVDDALDLGTIVDDKRGKYTRVLANLFSNTSNALLLIFHVALTGERRRVLTC